jgi:sulfide:quinone oxidoreductase
MRVRERALRDVRLSLVTPEQAPLELFGATASESVRELLERSGIDLYLSRYASRFDGEELTLVPGEPLRADRTVSLPRLAGPQLDGLPADTGGFIPVGPTGLVRGERDVFAAGDATNGCDRRTGGR